VIYRISRTLIGTPITADGAAAQPTPGHQFPWRVEFFHKSGGLKAIWNIGQNDCPIYEMEFERNLKGNGAGIIRTTFLDFPIDPTDYFDIFYDDTIIYSGVVDVAPDPKGGDVQLIGRHQYYSDRLISQSFSSNAASAIMQTIVESMDSETMISWNAALVDTGSTDLFTIEYNYEKISKVFDDLVAQLDDRYWGVNADGFFYCQELSQTTDDTLFYTDQPGYSSIEVAYDYSGIEATRYQVYKKVDGSGDTVRIGQVGYGAPYPSISAEKFTRIKEEVLTVSEVLSDAQALAYAYAKLTAQEALTTVTVNDIDLSVYNPDIGDLIDIQDREQTILIEVVDCDSTTGWTGATLETTEYVAGTGSVKFTATNAGDEMEYAFDGQTMWKNQQKLGFMCRASESGTYLSVDLSYETDYYNYGYGSGYYSEGAYGEGDTDGTESSKTVFTNTVNITAANVWNYYSFESTLPISQIRFYANAAPASPATVYIDRIQIYCDYRTRYNNNIVQINYSITPARDKVSMLLNSYDKYSNDALFRYDKQIRTLESALRSS